jgi:hypothetical protein
MSLHVLLQGWLNFFFLNFELSESENTVVRRKTVHYHIVCDLFGIYPGFLRSRTVLYVNHLAVV